MKKFWKNAFFHLCLFGAIFFEKEQKREMVIEGSERLDHTQADDYAEALAWGNTDQASTIGTSICILLIVGLGYVYMADIIPVAIWLTSHKDVLAAGIFFAFLTYIAGKTIYETYFEEQKKTPSGSLFDGDMGLEEWQSTLLTYVIAAIACVILVLLCLALFALWHFWPSIHDWISKNGSLWMFR